MHSNYKPQRHFSTARKRPLVDDSTHLPTKKESSTLVHGPTDNASNEKTNHRTKTPPPLRLQKPTTQQSILTHAADHSVPTKNSQSPRLLPSNRRRFPSEHHTLNFSIKDLSISPTKSNPMVMSWACMQDQFVKRHPSCHDTRHTHSPRSTSTSHKSFPELRMITWNIHAPCYRTIKKPANHHISEKHVSTHHSKPSADRIMESQCEHIYRDRMRRAFNLMKYLGKDEIDKMTLNTILNEEYHSLFRASTEHPFLLENRTAPQMPLDLIFLQEFWFNEDGMDRSWKHQGTKPIVTSDDPQEFPSFFKTLLDEHLPHYEAHGVQRPNGKPDGVVMLTNTKSPHWEVVGKRYLRLCGISTRVAVMLHLRSRKKYAIQQTEELHYIHLLACNTHLTFRTDCFDEVYRIGQLTNIFSSMEEYEKQLMQSENVPKDCIYSLLSGDFNFGERLITPEMHKDQVLQYLLQTGFKAINPHTRLVTHLDHRSEGVPADFVFTKELVHIKECCLIPRDLVDSKWGAEWFTISDHRPLYCELEFCPPQESYNKKHPTVNGSRGHKVGLGHVVDSDQDVEPTAPLPNT